MSVLNYTPKPWEPLWRTFHPEKEMEAARKLTEAQGARYDPPDESWINEEYQCDVKYLGPTGKAGVVSLSIKRRDKRPADDWRELQAIKNEIVGPEREAVQLYPAESRLVDMADQTWLWVMPVGEKVSIGFHERKVMTEPERRRSLGPANKGKGSQREWRPGISTGPHYNPGGNNDT